MKTKEQKKTQIEAGLKGIDENKTLVFADFAGVKVNELNAFRKSLHDAGARFEVFKKRLLRVAFQKKGIDINPEDFAGSVGIAFSKEGIEALSATVYGFAKNVKAFKILGGLDTELKKFFDSAEVTAIGSLPPREVLLSQVVGTIASPMSMFLYVLGERAKQVK